jgi:hypothetical protein
MLHRGCTSRAGGLKRPQGGRSSSGKSLLLFVSFSWHLQSHRRWDKFYELCVDSCSLSSQGTFQEAKPILWIGRTYPCPPPSVEGLVTTKWGLALFCVAGLRTGLLETGNQEHELTSKEGILRQTALSQIALTSSGLAMNDMQYAFCLRRHALSC